MEFRRVKEAVGDAWERMYALYETAFPYNERRTREDFETALLRDDFYCMFIYNKEEMPLGFLTYWEQGMFIYAEHFATLPHLRGQGYGREALSILKAQGKLIALEAELPQDEITTRRVGFYERAGFCTNPHKHLQPPYHTDSALLEMHVMSYPRALTAEEYDRFYAYVWEVVTGKRLFPEDRT